MGSGCRAVWMDLTGVAPYAAVMGRLFPELSNATTAPPLIKSLVSQGHTGSAAGRGFYEYSPEEAARWQSILTEHAWLVREIQAKLFALEPTAHETTL